jgi:hypothetical protein
MTLEGQSLLLELNERSRETLAADIRACGSMVFYKTTSPAWVLREATLELSQSVPAQ